MSLRCGVRRIATDGAAFHPWARIRLRHHIVFDIYFPCRCEYKAHVKAFLALYRLYYNHVRFHMALGRPSTPMPRSVEFERLKGLMEAINGVEAY